MLIGKAVIGIGADCAESALNRPNAAIRRGFLTSLDL